MSLDQDVRRRFAPDGSGDVSPMPSSGKGTPPCAGSSSGSEAGGEHTPSTPPNRSASGLGTLLLPTRFGRPFEEDLSDYQSGASTPAGSVNNSRRPSRCIDPAELQAAVDVSFRDVLDKERSRHLTEVASREYADEERSVLSAAPRERKNKYAIDVVSTKIPVSRTRSLRLAQKSLEMGQMAVCATWVLTIIISICISMQSAGMMLLSAWLADRRLDILELMVDKTRYASLAFLPLLCYMCVATAVSSYLVVFVAPRSGGSGVPDLKAFLNGNAIPDLFTRWTWFSRVVGLVLVTSAGLFAGIEGPCGHLGAITSLGIAEGVFKAFGDHLPFFGHRTSCEFVAQGCATGVAASFGAPVGGILFSFEEASSYWSKGLTWRSFVGSMLAAALAKCARTGFTQIPLIGFIEFPDPMVGWEVWELLPFMFTAVGTSLLGALFCHGVKSLTIARMVFYGRRGHRMRHALKMAEALSVCIVTICVCFWVPLLMGCKRLSTPRLSEAQPESQWSVGEMRRTLCPEGQYSAVGVILLDRHEAAIKELFTNSFEGGAEFSNFELLLCTVLIMGMTLITYGTALPTGLFIPNIMIGACFGRAVGQTMQSLGFDVHPGVHALVGTAGMLAGFSRMTISLTMITLEITNSMKLLPPVMLAILISKGIADRITESAYEIGVQYHPLGNISLIQGELDEEDMPLLKLLTVHDACSIEVQTLKVDECPSHIMSTLVQTKFSGFPLVSTPRNQVIGLVLREQLLQALQDSGELTAEPGEAKSGNKSIDLLPYADRTPEVKHWNTPLAKAHRHFTAAGLRHLCIVDEAHRLVGMLTRSDLAQLSHPRTRHQAIRALLYQKRAALAETEDGECGAGVDGNDSVSEDDGNDSVSETINEEEDEEDDHLAPGRTR